MAYRIFWTPIAVQDLRDICDFISRDNLVAAQRMGEELIKQSEAMAAFPLSGRIWCLRKKIRAEAAMQIDQGPSPCDCGSAPARRSPLSLPLSADECWPGRR
jgi:hypothetical protein